MSLALCLGCGSKDDATQNEADDTETGPVAKFDAAYRTGLRHQAGSQAGAPDGAGA